MRKTILLLCVLAPLWLFSQKRAYTIDFAILQTTGDFSSRVADDAKVSDATADQATITITKVPPGEDENIKLVYRADTSSEVPAESFSGGKLVFNVKDHLGAASRKFEIRYKNHPNGFFQWGTDQVAPPPAEKNDLTSYIAAMANANFVGNNKFLSNLTPVVNLGAIIDLKKKSYGKAGLFSWRLDINPYIGAQIDTKDSVSFIPAMMLGGRAGLGLNNYLSWGTENVEFTWMPLGFGLKILPDLKDSAVNIWQHNFRTGVSLKYQDIFILGVQYTYGFHNTTSESRNFYKTVFSKSGTDIQYLTLTGQFFVKSENEDTKSNYLFIEWRGLLNKKAYEPFINNTIITIGFRKDLVLTNTFATAVAAASGRKKIDRKKRPSIF